VVRMVVMVHLEQCGPRRTVASSMVTIFWNDDQKC
jgi:hypothetical protein